MENLMRRALEAAGGYRGLEEVEKEEYRDWVEMECAGEEVARAAHLVWLEGVGAAGCEQAERWLERAVKETMDNRLKSICRNNLGVLLLQDRGHDEEGRIEGELEYQSCYPDPIERYNRIWSLWDTEEADRGVMQWNKAVLITRVPMVKNLTGCAEETVWGLLEQAAQRGCRMADRILGRVEGKEREQRRSLREDEQKTRWELWEEEDAKFMLIYDENVVGEEQWEIHREGFEWGRERQKEEEKVEMSVE